MPPPTPTPTICFHGNLLFFFSLYLFCFVFCYYENSYCAHRKTIKLKTKFEFKNKKYNKKTKEISRIIIQSALVKCDFITYNFHRTLARLNLLTTKYIFILLFQKQETSNPLYPPPPPHKKNFKKQKQNKQK